MHRSAQAALSALKYEDIRAAKTDQPFGFFLTHESTKNKAGEVFHIILSDGAPDNYGLKSTCGSSGFITNKGAPLQDSSFCAKACDPNTPASSSLEIERKCDVP